MFSKNIFIRWIFILLVSFFVVQNINSQDQNVEKKLKFEKIEYYTNWDFNNNKGTQKLDQSYIKSSNYPYHFALTYKDNKPYSLHECKQGVHVDTCLYATNTENTANESKEDGEETENNKENNTASSSLLLLVHYLDKDEPQWADIYDNNKLIRRDFYDEKQNIILKRSYSTDFKLIKEENYNNNNELLSYRTLEYSKDSKITKDETYSADNKLSYKCEYEYEPNSQIKIIKVLDDGNNLINIKYYDKGVFTFGEDYIYENRKLSYVDLYSSNNSLSGRKYFDENNLVVKKEFFSVNSEHYMTEEYEYDKEKRLVFLVQTNPQGIVGHTIQYSFNKSGLLVREIKKYLLSNKLAKTEKSLYYYDDKKNMVKKVTLVKDMEGAEIKYYDKDGSIISYEEYQKIKGNMFF